MRDLLERLVAGGRPSEPLPLAEPRWRVTPARVHEEMLRRLGRALAIREVDAGSCNACELEINALNNPYYNLEGRGIRFVASPRHADLLLVTGSVTRNMREALLRAYDAMPAPKLVVAVGDCGAGRGPFDENYACVGSVAAVLPVDVVVPGCPPPPLEILRGLVTAVAARA
ncbi:MAG TPA: formate hydrogenlyase [Dokdonella sp.]